MSIFEQSSFEAQASDDDLMQPTDMMGSASLANQANAGASAGAGSPTRALVLLWVGALLAEWILGYIFRGARKG